MKFLLPKKPIFFDLLERLTSELEEINKLFKEFIQNFNNFAEYSRQAKIIEAKADSITHEIIARLNKTFITPLDREDIYLLAQELDDIIDLLENVIHNIQIYHIKEKNNYLDAFAQIIDQATADLVELVRSIREQKYSSRSQELTVNIHSLENQGDKFFLETIEKLFQEETSAIRVIKWKDILESLEQIADKYQKVANTIEGILLKAV